MGYPAAEEVNNNDLTETKEKPSTYTNQQDVDKPNDSMHSVNEKQGNEKSKNDAKQTAVEGED